jgi:hypothetical protein
MPAILAAVGLLAALPALAQYPGQVTKNAKDTPELRSIAVLEWTGEAGKPNRSRLVPVAVLDGGQLQDGGIYLARPEPLSLASEVEYELEQNGKPIGLYDIRNADQEQGSWVGYGSWRPMPVPRPRLSQQLARMKIDEDVQSDEPVLHRKHHADEKPASGSGGSSGSNGGSGGQSQNSDPVQDPDRPTLHRSPSSSTPSDSSTTASPSSTSQPSSNGASSSPPAPDTTSSQPSDPDRPTLHKSPSSDSTGASTSSTSTSSSDAPSLHRRDAGSSAGTSDTASDSGTTDASSNDPDRPVLHKARKVQQEDRGHADSVADAADPDRPTLKRGKSSGPALEVLPSLKGLPPDVQQTVAVSDAKTHPVHPWSYSWSSPDDEAKMLSALEDIARTALGINQPPPAPRRTPVHTGTTSVARKTRPAPPPPTPAPLSAEQFRVFELAYGSGATLVLSAHTDGPSSQQKFVTIVAQPDLYGNVLVVLKNVTDGAHLDEKPRMRLVDAVDAMADNRGELLFELRGATQRQFALYRVLRGQAEKLFVSGGGDFGTDNRD